MPLSRISGFISSVGVITLAVAGVCRVQIVSAQAVPPAAPVSVIVTDVAITVSPANIAVQAGATQQFSASVVGMTSASILWTSTGGSISKDGFFTAGSTPGSHVITASMSDGTASVAIPVIVAMAAPVTLRPGDNLAAAVAAAPEGTAFLLKSGVYRRQSITPKTGHAFLGEPGAILDGENVTAYAFETLASNPRSVTIRGLVIERYMPAWNLGAIQADNGADWIVERNEIRFNANLGLKVGARMRVRYNYVHHNGVSGIGGYRTDGVLIEDNEVAYNNPSNTFVDPSRAGESGLKFFEISHLVVRRNNVHHNNGLGIWCDNAYLNIVIENNTVTLNTLGGIWQEIGYSAVIRNNSVRENGLASPSPQWLEKAGIMVSNSPDVEVYGNTVSNNANGITGMQATGYATTGPYGARVLSNLYVHDNVITMAIGKTGLVQNVSDNSYFTNRNNRWVGNHYYLGANSNYFSWSNSSLDESQWRMSGQDVTGTFTR